MSDDQSGDFDGCECYFSHEFAMRRLLSLLRSSQTTCTDNECFDVTSPVASPNSESTDNFAWMMFMMIAAVILYLIRPNSLRRRNDDGLNKASRDDGPPNNEPPMAN